MHDRPDSEGHRAIQTENELPHPQVVAALGLRITNWATAARPRFADRKPLPAMLPHPRPPVVGSPPDSGGNGATQTENELPHPQVVDALGLRITNWAPLTSSR